LEVLATSDRLVISRLAHVEVTAALVRRARAVNFSPADLSLVLQAFEREVRDTFEIIELAAPLMFRAVDLARVHALRGADAVQLASAIISRPEPPAEFFFGAADQDLCDAAQAAGLAVIDPAR
jgi:hypothetical protein